MSAKDIQFVEWFRSITNKQTLHVFKSMKTDYFTVYGKEHTQYIAVHFYRSRQNIRSYPIYSDDYTDEKDPIDFILFRKQQFIPIVRDFVLRQNKTVVIYNRNETDEWFIEQKITSSNLSVGSMAEAAFNLISVIISFTKQTKTLGIALCNLSSYSFEITEFIEDDQYTKLSSLCIAKGVKHCIFKCKSTTVNPSEIDKFKRILQKNGVQFVNIQHTIQWNDEQSILNTIHNIIDKTSSKRLLNIMDHKLSRFALYAAILHQELQSDETHLNRYKLTQNKMNTFMRLDSAAFSALNLFPTAVSTQYTLFSEGNGNSNTSLYGILNKCQSVMGSRLLSVWIRQPLVDLKEIHKRQKLVKLFVENDECRQSLREEHLKSLIDLEKLSTKLRNKKSKRNSEDKLKDLVDLYNFAETIPWIQQTLNEMMKHQDNEHKTDESALNILKHDFIDPMDEIARNFNGYLAMIEAVVDLCTVSKRIYRIKSQYDALLDRYDKKIQSISAKMEQIKDHCAIKLHSEKIKLTLEYHKSYGYCLRIPRNKDTGTIETKLRKSKQIEVLSSQKKSVLFFTNKHLRIESHSRVEYEKQYKERQEVIVNKTVEIARTYIPVIDTAVSVFPPLDVLLSLAHVASYSPSQYSLPNIYPSSRQNKFIKMKNARHPCLERIQLDDIGGTGVIPNDVELIASGTNKSSFQIVTGPNMGGKSTYIRMIGLLLVMAQIGSYVPADECSFTIVDSILARVGAADNQLRGVSTFMAEMLQSASILEGATQNSLIIIDELGRGTSTYDGYGIAYAISEHIINELHSFCLFATHFHELSALSSQYECVVNKHVTTDFEKDEDTLTMLYKVKDGPCPESFGIQVAKMAAFSNDIIETAQVKAKHLATVSKGYISTNTLEVIQTIYNNWKQMCLKHRNSRPEIVKKAVETLKQHVINCIDQDRNGELDEILLRIEKKCKG